MLAPRSLRTGACPDISYYLASAYLERHEGRAGSVISTLVLQCTPRLPPAVLQQRVAMEARRALTEGERSTRIVFASLSGAVNRMARLPGRRSLVFVSPGFTRLPSFEEQSLLMDKAVRAGIVIHTLDARGVYGEKSYDASLSLPPSPAVMDFLRLERSEQGNVLAELAEATGGTRFHNDNDLGVGFQTLAGASEIEYLLGFASNAKDGRLHGLKVTVKDCDGCVVSARRSYYAPKPGEAPPAAAPGMAAEDVVDTPLELRFDTKHDAISVTAYLDVSRLSFTKAGDSYTRSVPVLFAIFDWNGLLLKSEAKRFEFRLTEAEWKLAQKHGLPLRADLDAAPGDYLVRVVVADTNRAVLSSVTRAATVR